MIINSYLYAVTGGGGPDVTPDAVDAFDYAEFDNSYYTAVNAIFQITGIDTTITLKAFYADGNYGVGNFKMYYAVVDSIGIWPSEIMQTVGTLLENNGTFTVTNGKYVVIGCGETAFEVGDTIQIKNVSDSDAILTTINAISLFGF